MRIVVLVKPVPDTTGQERLGPDLRVDRVGVPAVINANDEYALEAALKLVEADGEGEVVLLAMAPAARPETRSARRSRWAPIGPSSSATPPWPVRTR